MKIMELAIIYLILFLLPIFLLLKGRFSKRLPPGSMGFPFVGHSLGFLKAMRTNKAEQWLQERVTKYGPISKLSLFGAPTVFLHGPAANKFIYTSNNNTLANQQPASIRRIMGERNLLELKRDDHKRVRAALVTFLKPEALKNYVGRIDEEIRMHLTTHWEGTERIAVMPLMKTLTFNVICSLIFGIERGTRRDLLVQLFQKVMEGMLSVPINFPFTRFSSSLKASAKVKVLLKDLIGEKREELRKQGAPSHHQDLISCLLNISDERDVPVLSDEEVVDNAFVVMLAGYDTTSILLTFLMRLLANNPSVYAKVLQEQEEIAKNKALGTLLTWDDVANMKYTWRVATENLRMYPPVFCSFRKTLKDIEYGGYIIPKGWQLVWAACMTHMDDTIFPDASKFDPSRYENGAAPPYSFIPFGGGPRMCPGYEFARIETLTMIHYLVTRFTWKLASKDEFFYRDPMPVFNQGLIIDIEQKNCDNPIYI